MDAVCTRLGIEAQLNRRFVCVFPSHGDRCTGKLWRDERSLVLYRCDHGGTRPYALAEVYAGVVGGGSDPLTGPTLARWKLRLLADLGWLRLEPIDVTPLPGGATLADHAVYAGIVLLFQIRALTEEPGEPSPLARRFLARWCRVSESTAERAKVNLESWGIITKVGTYASGARETGLWVLEQVTL